MQIRAEIDQAIEAYGRARIGIVLGTSTSGIDEASQGIAHYLREQRFPMATTTSNRNSVRRPIFFPNGSA